ncbi:MAG TPA: tetratricopeptide repeat protein [Rudaea sp.]|nr:tetratricopeptide repeat protein [Rudaea sp.]
MVDENSDYPVSDILKDAMTLHAEGRYDEAIERFRDVLKHDPQSVSVRHALALALHQVGNDAEAICEFDLAVKQGANEPMLHANRAAVLLALGRLADAEQSCRQALNLQPKNFAALFNLGLTLEKLGRPADALISLNAALDTRPDALGLAKVLARVAVAMNDADSARQVLPILLAKPEKSTLILIGDIYQTCSDIESAWHVWREAAIDPMLSTKARLRISRTALTAGRPDIAQIEADTVLHSEAASRDAMLLQALALHEGGQIEEAIASYQKLLKTHPDFAEAGSNYLIAIQHAAETTPAEIFLASKEWAEHHAPKEDFVAPVIGTRTRRRVIWISPRFSQGPVDTFFATVLAEMRKQENIEHTLVMTGFENDSATAKFRLLADRWIDAARMKDEELLHVLRRIDADVAVDLAGHAPRNRLCVFARRLAPRQCTWLDNFSTTGLPAMDEFLSDERLTPQGMEDQFTEKVIRLPLGRLAYTPPELLLAKQPLQDRARSGLLVCFNRMAKVTSAMLDVWAKILLALPAWRLLLRNSAVMSPQVRARIISTFARHGVDSNRIEFEGFGTYAETLGGYGRADLALDTYPFGGCATTCDALWMGVPVVTLRGNTLVSRQSAALLDQCGLGNWVASSVDEYVEIACRLAVAKPVDLMPRAALRQITGKRLCDVEKFAQSLLQTILGDKAA